MCAGLAGQDFHADDMRRLSAAFTWKTRNSFGDIKSWMCAGRALTAKPANQVARRALDRPHPGGIAMGAHIHFDERRATFGNHLGNGCFERDMAIEVLDQGEARSGLFINAAHHD